MVYNPNNERVAAVCGCQVRIYDAVSPNGVRALLYKQDFTTHGHALLWAQEHDDRVKASCERAGLR